MGVDVGLVMMTSLISATKGACMFNTLRLRQNCRYFADDIFKCIFLNSDVWVSLKISLKFVPKFPINNNPALVQIKAWRRPGDKPLSEPMMVSLMAHICVTRPQWVKKYNNEYVLLSTWRSRNAIGYKICWHANYHYNTLGITSCIHVVKAGGHSKYVQTFNAERSYIYNDMFIWYSWYNNESTQSDEGKYSADLQTMCTFDIIVHQYLITCNFPNQIRQFGWIRYWQVITIVFPWWELFYRSYSIICFNINSCSSGFTQIIIGAVP